MKSLLMMCVLFSGACGHAGNKPKRNKNIPAAAQWYGGADGGVWMVVDSSKVLFSYEIAIYNEDTGGLLKKGIYRFSAACQEERIPVIKIKAMIDGYDGHRIFLDKIKAGRACVLEPVVDKDCE